MAAEVGFLSASVADFYVLRFALEVPWLPAPKIDEGLPSLCEKMCAPETGFKLTIRRLKRLPARPCAS
jgi:hypothetical protein